MYPYETMSMTELFAYIFDKEDRVKACGRAPCQTLITNMERRFPGVNFGDKETGYMNAETLLSYRDKVLTEREEKERCLY